MMAFAWAPHLNIFQGWCKKNCPKIALKALFIGWGVESPNPPTLGFDVAKYIARFFRVKPNLVGGLTNWLLIKPISYGPFLVLYAPPYTLGQVQLFLYSI